MSSNQEKKKLWTKNLILITLINFLIYSSFQLFPTALPPYVKSLGAPEKVLGWITGLTTISALIFRPITGMILDTKGRKGVFYIGMIIMILSTIGYKIFPIVSIILIFRIIHGVGWGISTTASNTIASDSILKERFGEGMGYFSLSISLALAIAPALSLILHIQTVILLALILLLITFVLIYFVEEKEEVLIDSKEDEEKKSPYEKKSILPAVIIFLTTTTYGGIVTFLSIFAEERGIENISIFFTVFAISMVLTRPLLGKMLDKKGFKPSILLGFGLLVPGLLLLSRINGISGVIISALLYGIGYGSLQTSLQTMAIMESPDNRAGAANATYYTGFDGGIGFGSIISGILASKVGYQNMFTTLCIFPLIGLIIYSLNSKGDNKSLKN